MHCDGGEDDPHYFFLPSFTAEAMWRDASSAMKFFDSLSNNSAEGDNQTVFEQHSAPVYLPETSPVGVWWTFCHFRDVIEVRFAALEIQRDFRLSWTRLGDRKTDPSSINQLYDNNFSRVEPKSLTQLVVVIEMVFFVLIILPTEPRLRFSELSGTSE